MRHRCAECEGTGYIWVYYYADAEYKRETCPKCQGRGVLGEAEASDAVDEPISLSEKAEWVMATAGSVCDDRVAEYIVEMLEKQGHRFVRRDGRVMLEKSLEESEWLAVVAEVVNKVRSGVPFWLQP